jgi:starch synthase (maltosyl-transferring)
VTTPPPTAASPVPEEGRRRAQIEGVAPEIDGGRFPVKRIAGDRFSVEADIFADGHDRLGALLLHRGPGEEEWAETPMEPLGNDRWRGTIVLGEPGRYHYTLEAWVDPFRTWRGDLAKWLEAEADVALELLEGALLVEAAAERAQARVAEVLEAWANRLRGWAGVEPGELDHGALLGPAGPLRGELPELMSRFPDRRLATRYERELELVVDRERARFSAWYEFFPRSTSPEPGRHGTFEDARRMLPYIKGMGFDVVYLPPIHPIALTNRKGPNNRTTSRPGDPGSPWAIGAVEGGHTAIHEELGTLDDFRGFREAAEEQGMEVALDVAFQCSPDHPWVAEHPEWFRARPDGSIRHAENPPKKYEDIYPLDFETEDWEGLWEALRDIFLFWMEHGVRIFRVDNPHTKALPFWEWVIDELKARDPGLILLSEAFTRPRMMYRLAKLGFTQSYTYFAWRNTKHELTSYTEELTGTELREYFRPNFWPNTPDILTEYLQTGGRPAFVTRLVLAATLASSYGIYGPPFELMEHVPREPGSEEYLDSEKYQLRSWELDRPDSLRDLIARVNRIRRENPALHHNESVRFHPVDNERIIAWTKTDPGNANRILVVVNLDPHHVQSGWLDLDRDVLGLEGEESFQVHDLLAGGRFLWTPGANYVELKPAVSPAHIFRVMSRTRREEDFEYF